MKSVSVNQLLCMTQPKRILQSNVEKQSSVWTTSWKWYTQCCKFTFCIPLIN